MLSYKLSLCLFVLVGLLAYADPSHSFESENSTTPHHQEAPNSDDSTAVREMFKYLQEKFVTHTNINRRGDRHGPSITLVLDQLREYSRTGPLLRAEIITCFKRNAQGRHSKEDWLLYLKREIGQPDKYYLALIPYEFRFTKNRTDREEIANEAATKKLFEIVQGEYGVESTFTKDGVKNKITLLKLYPDTAIGEKGVLSRSLNVSWEQGTDKLYCVGPLGGSL